MVKLRELLIKTGDPTKNADLLKKIDGLRAVSQKTKKKEIVEMDARKIGEVKWFNREKGYGFIASDEGEEIFVHYTDIVGRKIISDGQKVTFEIGEHKGKPTATNVEIVPEII